MPTGSLPVKRARAEEPTPANAQNFGVRHVRRDDLQWCKRADCRCASYGDGDAACRPRKHPASPRHQQLQQLGRTRFHRPQDPAVRPRWLRLDGRDQCGRGHGSRQHGRHHGRTDHHHRPLRPGSRAVRPLPDDGPGLPERGSPRSRRLRRLRHGRHHRDCRTRFRVQQLGRHERCGPLG